MQEKITFFNWKFLISLQKYFEFGEERERVWINFLLLITTIPRN